MLLFILLSERVCIICSDNPVDRQGMWEASFGRGTGSSTTGTNVYSKTSSVIKAENAICSPVSFMKDIKPYGVLIDTQSDT